MSTSTDSPTAPGSGASHVLAFVYWLVVLVPLGWGVFQTVQKSIPLFHVTQTAVVAPAPGAASTPQK